MRADRGVLPFAIALCCFAQASQAGNGLIQELEVLRNSLAASDTGRPALTLKLADQYFDDAVEISAKGAPSAADTETADRERKKALALYREALSGERGAFAPLKGDLKVKVQFQIARIDEQLGSTTEARDLYLQIVQQDSLKDLKREAALRLAESSEKNSPINAEKYYQLALDLCSGTDMCSYAHYKKAWLLKNSARLDAAIAEIKLALWDAKAQLREEALRDLILFMGSHGGDGLNELKYTEELAQKINRPALLIELSDAFYATGNKVAGTRVLEISNAREPQLKNEIKLLEEYYGLRDWNQFHTHLAITQDMAKSNTAAATKDLEAEKVLRRLTVQLDGERITQSQIAPDFKAVVMLYLSLYPQTSEKMHMIDGWLAAESSPEAKLAQLQKWLSDNSLKLSGADALKLHEMRAAIAQKQNDNEIVASEMSALVAARLNPIKEREYRYHQAHSLYNLKRFDEALPIFIELSRLDSSAEQKPDVWAVQSQNLTLDIYNQQKNYKALLQQAHSWTENKTLARTVELQKEIGDMSRIAEEAEFTQAVQLGKDSGALQTFEQFCLAGKMLPKSCENAKVLSVQMGNETALLSILKTQNDKAALIAEYEAAGYFAEAAALLESTTAQAHFDLKNRLKIALLYEIGGKIESRDRILRDTLIQIGKQKAGKVDEALEGLLINALISAHMLKPDLLKLGFSSNAKITIADQLAQLGPLTGEEKKILLSQTQSAGKGWAIAVLDELKNLDQFQSALHFYGKSSQRRFQMRLAALKKEADFGDKYLNGAEVPVRLVILSMLEKAQSALAAEIRQTPLPPELGSEEKKNVEESLNQMASPFEDRAGSYKNLAQAQVEKLDPGLKGKFENLASVSPFDYREILSSTSGSGNLAPLTGSEIEAVERSITALHSNPMNGSAVAEIHSIYKKNGNERVASYFQGRMAQLEKAGEEVHTK